MKSGRKRLYGVPLVFHSFEELCEVNEIQIGWEFLYPSIFAGWLPLYLHVENAIGSYLLASQKSE